MPTLDDAEARPPSDFARLLAVPDPVLLVGGQAVNLWAIFYETRTRELAPFVSRDVDVLGSRETLESLAQIAGVVPQFFPLRPPSNEIGVVVARDDHGQPLIIEVLRYAHGASNEEFQQPAYTFAIGDTRVRVPGPIALLQAKTANVADIPQTGRQDIRHVRILARLMPGYLADLQTAVHNGKIPERQLIVMLEQLLGVLGKEKTQHILAKLEISRHELFESLDGSQLHKVNAFLTKRLPRLLS